MEQEIINNEALIKYLIIATSALVTAIGALVGAIVVMWRFQNTKMTGVIEENTKSSVLVSDGLKAVSDAVKELKDVIKENTNSFREWEKTNIQLTEQIKKV